MSGAESPHPARTAHFRKATVRYMDPPRPGQLSPPRCRVPLFRRMRNHPPAEQERPPTTTARLSLAKVLSHKPWSATAKNAEKGGAKLPRAHPVTRQQTPTRDGTGSAGNQAETTDADCTRSVGVHRAPHPVQFRSSSLTVSAARPADREKLPW